MRGYLVKKNKRYYAVVYEGTDPLTRRERRTWRAAGTSRREADRFPGRACTGSQWPRTCLSRTDDT